MKTDMKARLEAAIKTWFDAEAEESGGDFGFYVHDEMPLDMVAGAVAVFDSCGRASLFSENETE